MGSLTPQETRELLARDILCRLATIRADGSPRLTPLWFIFEGGAFHMTSLAGKTHLRDIERDPRVAVLVDAEEPPTPGTRLYRRAKASGRATLVTDPTGTWTRRITLKYIPSPEGDALASARASEPRVLIRVSPARLNARRSNR